MIFELWKTRSGRQPDVTQVISDLLFRVESVVDFI